MRTAAMAAGWVVSRALLCWLLLGPQEWVRGDVTYFDQSLGNLSRVGVDDTLVEYPVPALGVVALPWALARLASGLGLDWSYGVLLMTAAALTDLVLTVLLARRDRAAALAWLLAVPLLGATAYARFDLLPGALCALAVLLVSRHPRAAAACVALATGIKLWPALVAPSLLAVSRPRRGAVTVLGVTGAVLAVVSVALGGLGRLLSPLTYQADRGLQIESVLATPAMIAWWADPVRWSVDYAPSNAYEITGPGVGVLLALSTLLTVLYVVSLGLAWWWLWALRDRVSGATVLWVALAAVTGFVVVGKVLSPQYLLWLLPLASAGLAVVGSAALRWWTAALLVATGLTQVVFPAYYGQITLGGDLVWLPVAALAMRNLLMVLLLGTAVGAVVAGLRRDAQRGMPLDRQPPGPAKKAGTVLR